MNIFDGRTITLMVAIATLASNILSSVLFHQLPDDPYHLASNFGWYLHFANVLSVFGFIGAVRVGLFPITNPPRDGKLESFEDDADWIYLNRNMPSP
jgi:hypothetical protein